MIQNIVDEYVGNKYDPQCIAYSFAITKYGFSICYVTDEVGVKWLLFPDKGILFCMLTSIEYRCDMNTHCKYHQLASGKLFTFEQHRVSTCITYWKLVGFQLVAIQKVTLPFVDMRFVIPRTLDKDDYIVLTRKTNEQKIMLVCFPFFPFTFTVFNDTNFDHADIGNDYLLMYYKNHTSVQIYDTTMKRLSYAFHVDFSVFMEYTLCFLRGGKMFILDLKTMRMVLEVFTEMTELDVFDIYLHSHNDDVSEIWDLESRKLIRRTKRMTQWLFTIDNYHVSQELDHFSLVC